MALMFHSPPYSVTSKPYHLLSGPKPKFTVKSQTPSQPPKPAIAEPSDDPASVKKPASPGLGFGSNSSSSSKSNSSTVSSNSRKKQKIKRERASIIRREPLEKPEFFRQEDKVKAEEQSKNESAFLLTWLGLGGVILVQGIVLAASGLKAASGRSFHGFQNFKKKCIAEMRCLNQVIFKTLPLCEE